MKVAVVAGAIHRAKSGVYGSEAQAAVLARGFERAGHEVTFVAAAGSDRVGRFLPVPCMYGAIWPNEEVNQYEWYKDELVTQDLILDWSGTHRVAENMRFWERERFRGVLIWSHQGNVFTSPRPPAITDYHGVCVSQAQKNHALGHWIFNVTPPPADRIHVIPYGIETQVFVPPPAGSRREYFLYLSRPHPHKGIFEFLEIARAVPDEKFVMAFDMAAPDHKQYGLEAIEKAKELPNVTYVPLKGSQAKKVEMYQGAKALIQPLAKDYTEGFGLVFAEAMSCGTPCITANHGGQVDVVGDVGYLCDAGAHDQYVEAVREFTQGAAWRDQWPKEMLPAVERIQDQASSDVVRKRIVRHFSVERWVAAYLKLYAKVRRELDTPPWAPFPEWMYA